MFLREVHFVKLLSGTSAGLLRLGPHAWARRTLACGHIVELRLTWDEKHRRLAAYSKL